MTAIVSRAELLRPWADAPCPCLAATKNLREALCEACRLNVDVHDESCDRCGGSGLDKRFDALRGEHHDHEQQIAANGREAGFWCINCGERADYDLDEGVTERAPYCLRTDLSALVRVAAACGEAVLRQVLEAVLEELLLDVAEPEDSAARALVAALPERAA